MELVRSLPAKRCCMTTPSPCRRPRRATQQELRPGRRLLLCLLSTGDIRKAVGGISVSPVTRNIARTVPRRPISGSKRPPAQKSPRGCSQGAPDGPKSIIAKPIDAPGWLSDLGGLHGTATPQMTGPFLWRVGWRCEMNGACCWIPPERAFPAVPAANQRTEMHELWWVKMGGELSGGGDIRGVGSAAPRGDRNYRYV